MTNPDKNISGKFNKKNPEAVAIPNFIEETKKGAISQDVYSRLYKDGNILLDTDVNAQMASAIIAQLQAADTVDTDEPVNLYINSPGGSVHAGMAIYDTMRQMKRPVRTIGMGLCASMGSFLLSAGAPGMRHVLPNAQIMVHQPAAGSQGKVSDMQISQYSVDNTKRQMQMLYANFMGMDWDQYEKYKGDIDELGDRDSWINATIAKELGLVDDIKKPENYGKDPHVTREYDMTMKLQQIELDEIGTENRHIPKHMTSVNRLIEAQKEIRAAAASADNSNKNTSKNKNNGTKPGASMAM